MITEIASITDDLQREVDKLATDASTIFDDANRATLFETTDRLNAAIRILRRDGELEGAITAHGISANIRKARNLLAIYEATAELKLDNCLRHAEFQ